VITAALAFTLLAQLTPETPVAPPLANNSPEYEYEIHLAAAHGSFLMTYGSYTTLVAQSIDPQSGEILSQTRSRLGIFGADLAPFGDGYLHLTFGSNDLIVTPLDDQGVPRGETRPVIPGIWGALGVIGSEALVAGAGDGMIIDRDARPLRQIPLTIHGELRQPPAIAASRDRYLVARVDDDGLYATIVSARGEVVAVTPRIGSGRTTLSSRISAASDGSGFLIAWRDVDDLRTIAVAADGTVGAMQHVATLDIGSTYILTWIGDAYLMAFNAQGDLFGQRVSRDGALAGTPFLLAEHGNAKGGVAVAWNGERTLVAWIEGYACGTGSDVFGRFLDGEPILYSPGTPDQAGPALVAGAIAWNERSGVSHVRVSAGGVTYSAPSAGVAAQDSVALGTDGGDVLAVWRETRIDGCRNVLVAAPLSRFDTSHVIADNDRSLDPPSIAFNGVDYAVAWAGTDGRVWTARVRRDGTVAAPPAAVTATETPQTYATFYSITPGLVWTGSDYLLLRERLISYYIPWHSLPPVTEVRLLRLSAGLVPLGPEELLATGVTPAIAWNGSDALAVWREGTSLVSMPIGSRNRQTVAAGTATVAPRVIWGGSEYVVSWGPQIAFVQRDGRPSSALSLPDGTGMSVAAKQPSGALIFAYEQSVPPQSHRIVTRVGIARHRAVGH
jgi:hypothetical protein